LKNHLAEIVALDFVTVPTIGLKVLFVLVVLPRGGKWYFST
jgi:hypothetical protein